jgi:hypothetical protein
MARAAALPLRPGDNQVRGGYVFRWT